MDRKYIPHHFLLKQQYLIQCRFRVMTPQNVLFQGVLPPDIVNFYNFNTRKKYYNVIF